MWKHLVKIWNSQLSIDWMYPLIDRNHEENLNKLSARLDCFSIATQSVKKIIRSIENNSRPIKNLKKTITNFLSNSTDSRLLVDRSIQNKFRLIKIFDEIFQKNFVSIDQKWLSIDRSSWNRIFQNFHQTVCNSFSWTNYHHMNIIDRV